MTDQLRIVHREAERHLEAIAAFFKPGAKLTLLVRQDLGPALDADLVLTNDTLPEAIAALERRHLKAGGGDVEAPPNANDIIARFGNVRICDRCQAYVSSYGYRCIALLDERCPGFEEYERLLSLCAARRDDSSPKIWPPKLTGDEA